MQIQKIQSNSTSFGYNPLLNAQLMNDLSKAKKNKAYFDYIKNLCSITNQTELKLREADKKSMPELTDKLARIFLPIKVVLTDILDELFPNYNYKAKELETYQEELDAKFKNNEKSNWLTALVWHMRENVHDTGLDELQEMVQNEDLMPDDMQGENVITSFIRLQQVAPGAIAIVPGTLSSDTDEQEVENVEEDKQIANKEAEEGDNTELEDKIKLGKSKVVEYVPEGHALEGFAGLGGMKELKAELKDKVVDFLKDPIQAKMDAEDYGTKLPKGLLFYGPPGCGKTTILEHLAVEAGVPLLKLEAGTLKGSYIHESSIYTDAAFEYAYSIAKPEKPVIMMIDDADAFFVSRDEHSKSWDVEEMTTFLNKIQEAPKKNVVVALTTNKYDIMDTAVKRRFDTQVYIGLPDEEARKSLLKLFFSRNNMSKSLSENDEVMARLAKKTENFPISALQDMAYDACDIPRREAKEAREKGIITRRDVTEADFDTVLNRIENQNKKIKEDLYKTKATRKSIGF